VAGRLDVCAVRCLGGCILAAWSVALSQCPVLIYHAELDCSLTGVDSVAVHAPQGSTASRCLSAAVPPAAVAAASAGGINSAGKHASDT